MSIVISAAVLFSNKLIEMNFIDDFLSQQGSVFTINGKHFQIYCDGSALSSFHTLLTVNDRMMVKDISQYFANDCQEECVSNAVFQYVTRKEQQERKKCGFEDANEKFCSWADDNITLYNSITGNAEWSTLLLTLAQNDYLKPVQFVILIQVTAKKTNKEKLKVLCSVLEANKLQVSVTLQSVFSLINAQLQSSNAKKALSELSEYNSQNALRVQAFETKPVTGCNFIRALLLNFNLLEGILGASAPRSCFVRNLISCGLLDLAQADLILNATTSYNVTVCFVKEIIKLTEADYGLFLAAIKRLSFQHSKHIIFFTDYAANLLKRFLTAWEGCFDETTQLSEPLTPLQKINSLYLDCKDLLELHNTELLYLILIKHRAINKALIHKGVFDKGFFGQADMLLDELSKDIHLDDIWISTRLVPFFKTLEELKLLAPEKGTKKYNSISQLQNQLKLYFPELNNRPLELDLDVDCKDYLSYFLASTFFEWNNLCGEDVLFKELINSLNRCRVISNQQHEALGCATPNKRVKELITTLFEQTREDINILFYRAINDFCRRIKSEGPNTEIKRQIATIEAQLGISALYTKTKLENDSAVKLVRAEQSPTKAAQPKTKTVSLRAVCDATAIKPNITQTKATNACDLVKLVRAEFNAIFENRELSQKLIKSIIAVYPEQDYRGEAIQSCLKVIQGKTTGNGDKVDHLITILNRTSLFASTNFCKIIKLLKSNTKSYFFSKMPKEVEALIRALKDNADEPILSTLLNSLR